jgi:outer membrane protein TolC
MKLAMMVLAWGAASMLSAQTALTLDAAIEFAGRNSPDIQRSLYNLKRFQESLNAQKASLKSQFSLSINPAEYSNRREFDNRFSTWFTNENFTTSGTFRVDQPILWTDGTLSLVNTFGWQYNNSDFTGDNEETRSFSNDLYLSLNQPLFTYNRQKLALTELELDFENANISYALQKLNLERNVTQFFYNVHLAQMSLVIADEELANTRKSYEIIRNKVDAGLAAMEELYQAELNLATAQSNLYNEQVRLENTKDEFKLFLGMDLYDDILVLADVSADSVAVDLEKAVEHGLASRMELRQREIDIENSQFQMIQTKALNEFRGDLQLSVGFFGENENIGEIFENPTRSPRVSLAFDIPLWDWGERKARIKAQEALIKTEELNFEQEKLQIIIDIRQVYRNLQNQLNQIEIARQNEKNAQLTYEINLERYENGDLTGMDLNLYQTQLSENKMSLAQALINYKIELLNLKIQSLYDFEMNVPVVPDELFKDSEEIMETLGYLGSGWRNEFPAR